MKEKRKHKRLEFDVSIELERFGEDGAAVFAYVPVEVSDISRSGIGFRTAQKLDEGSCFNTKIQFSAEEVIQIVVQVVRREEMDGVYKYGGSFVNMTESDALKIDIYQIFHDVE